MSRPHLAPGHPPNHKHHQPPPRTASCPATAKQAAGAACTGARLWACGWPLLLVWLCWSVA